MAEPPVEVWLVTVGYGCYSDFVEVIDSVWSDEAGAVSHIVRDLRGTLSDTRSRGCLIWELDPIDVIDEWGGGWDDDVQDFLPVTAEAPWWWDVEIEGVVTYDVRRMAVRHG